MRVTRSKEMAILSQRTIITLDALRNIDTVCNANSVAPCMLPLNQNMQDVRTLPNELSYGPDKTRNNMETSIRVDVL